MMGGVNESPNYVNLMGFGRVNPDASIVVTDSLLQGGIMSVFYLGTLIGCMFGGWFGDKFGRISAIGLGALWGISVHHCSVLLRTATG